jgi:antirestriction protein
MSSPKIYVACLASYNAGCLHGAWIDADQDVDQINEEIQAILKASKENGAEEYAIHDYEGFGKIQLSEYESISKVSELAKAIEEHGESFECFYQNDSFDSVSDAVEAYSDCYAGEFKSKEEWAESFLEETGGLSEMPERLRCYFDFEKYARDCEYGGDMNFFEVSYNRVYAFHSR